MRTIHSNAPATGTARVRTAAGSSRLCVLQLNTHDLHGGAAAMARQLHQAYSRAGHDSWFCVGEKVTDDPHTLALRNRSAWVTWCHLRRKVAIQRKTRLLPQIFEKLARLDRYERGRQHSLASGHEDFFQPATRRLLDTIPSRPDILHGHNLHGSFFDLRELPRLSNSVSTVLTLHDAWLLSGHCAHSFDCERWRTGCGSCPDLSIYPAIPVDATAENWSRKREIYARSRLFVAAPSKWLLDKAQASILHEGIREARVIPYSVDTDIYCAADKATVRRQLGLPESHRILLFAANGIRSGIFKDYLTLRAGLEQLTTAYHDWPILLIALGEDGPSEHIGTSELRFVPFQKDLSAVARYYQASDVYVHVAKVDTFPNTVLEALACGVPVVATAVGGIPEQVKGWNGFAGTAAAPNNHAIEDATGALVPPKDPAAIAQAVLRILDDPSLARQLGANAAKDARRRFAMGQHANAYLDWYRAILDRLKMEQTNARRP